MSSARHMIYGSYNLFNLINQKTCFYVKTSHKLISPILIQTRHRSRVSRFPKEDGITKLEEMAERFNPPPNQKEQENQAVPADQGFTIDSTGQIFSSYVPPEKKQFMLTGQGANQRWESLKALVQSTYAVAMIKRNVKPFRAVDFAKAAQKKFIDVNNALQEDSKKSDLLMKEHATLMVIRALKTQFQNPAKKVHWRFLEEIDRPKVVHARVASIYDKDNLFAQVTVRMHSEQILAIKDRYNRTLKGDAKKSKNVIDYVVFERHLKDPYGKWRICGKVFL